MKTLILFFLSIVILTSCIFQKENDINNPKVNAEIAECYKQKSKEIPVADFNLISLYEGIENILIKQEFLDNSSKESYKILFDEFEQHKEDKQYKLKLMRIYNTLIKDNANITWINTPDLFNVPEYCILSILDKNKLQENKMYYGYYKLMKEYVETGKPEKWSLNKRFLDSIPNNEFSNIVYRAPYIAILYNHISFNKD